MRCDNMLDEKIKDLTCYTVHTLDSHFSLLKIKWLFQSPNISSCTIRPDKCTFTSPDAVMILFYHVQKCQIKCCATYFVSFQSKQQLPLLCTVPVHPENAVWNMPSTFRIFTNTFLWYSCEDLPLCQTIMAFLGRRFDITWQLFGWPDLPLPLTSLFTASLLLCWVFGAK